MTQTSPSSGQKSTPTNDKVKGNNQAPLSPNPIPENKKPIQGNSDNVNTWWQSKNLRFKATLIAIALGVIPVTIVGSIIGGVVSKSFETQIKNAEQQESKVLAQDIKLIISDRFDQVQGMAQVLTELPAFRNRDRAALSTQLTNFQDLYRYFDTIAVFDSKGEPIAKTGGPPLGNHFQRTYIQSARQARGTIVSQPIVSEWDGTFGVYFASTLINPDTGEIEGFLRARLPVSELRKFIIGDDVDDGENVYLGDGNQQIFVSSESELVGKTTTTGQRNEPTGEEAKATIPLGQLFSQLRWEGSGDNPITIKDRNELENVNQIVTFKPINLELNSIPLNWSLILAGDSNLVLAPVRNILWFIFIGTLLSAAIVGYIASVLANKLIKPIETTSNAVKDIAKGDLDTVVAVQGQDEIAQLGKNINKMTADLKTLLQEQQTFANQSSLLKNITLEMTKAFDENEVFNIAVTEIRQALKADRVCVYQFDENWQGVFIAESVDKRYPQALGAKIYDPCFADKYIDKYLQGRVQATPDIYKAGLTDCHLQQLEPFQVKANIVAPIIVDGNLLGLLIAHQCSAPRTWQEHEIDFFSQTATQIGPALERASLVKTQQLDSYLSQRLKDISFKVAECLNQEKVFEVATQQGRADLQADRVIVYTFDEDWKGTIIAESVDPQYPQSLGANIKDPCFADKYVEKYQQGRVQATNNIYTAGLTDCHLQQLEPFAVKANLVTPVIVEGNLLGLLIAHQCDAPRKWTVSESNYLAQLATQIGPALERIQLLEKQQKSEQEQRQAREKMQQRALELLMQVDPVSQGDLTIRASVTEDEIGTIADSYNATIENLRKIVTQVQGGTQAVTDTVTEQEAFVGSLATEVIRQADDINLALEKIQTLAYSARLVLDNAEQAEQAVQQANKSVEDGEVAMNRTVDGILAIRETVAETAKKVKRLGESTQKISKVVNLISSFADQTNLLALNASIEAAHAGEEGRGFAVVADEVRSLARQSAEATAEIEKVVAEIQTETNDVVKAMESGTEQVVEGTRLVEETRESLNQITAVSAQINQLVTSISTAAAEQSQTSEDITETMADVAGISNETAQAVNQVSETFRKLLQVAEELQYSVSKFKVQ